MGVTALEDLYDEHTNPNGYINVSVAENALSLPLVADALSNAPPVPPSELMYGAMEGSYGFRAAVAALLERYALGCPVRPEHIIALTGAGSVLDALGTVLCDPGDKVLLTGPGYRGFERDFRDRAGVGVAVAALDGEFGGRLSMAALEKGWTDAGGPDSGIKAVLVCSPNNPLGSCLGRDLICDVVSWGREKRLQILFDEAYALSVHSPATKFCSVAEALGGVLGDDVHIIWTFSKDFCISGCRVGILYSQCDELLTCIKSVLTYFASTSRHTQWALTAMLRDDSWVKNYISENRSRLRRAYCLFTGMLDKHAVPYIEADAGFFVWVDLREWMTGNSCDDEMVLWRKMCQEARVVTTSGSECFGSEFGFFRFCFAAVDSDTLIVGWERLISTVLRRSHKR